MSHNDEQLVKRLREELDEAGLRRFRIHAWLSDEWCSPDGIPGVGVPFSRTIVSGAILLAASDTRVTFWTRHPSFVQLVRTGD